MLAGKRKEIDESQKAGRYFSNMAAQSREFADRLRKL